MIQSLESRLLRTHVKNTIYIKTVQCGSCVIIYDLRGHNWMLFAHRPYCTVTLNSNFAILQT